MINFSWCSCLTTSWATYHFVDSLYFSVFPNSILFMILWKYDIYFMKVLLKIICTKLFYFALKWVSLVENQAPSPKAKMRLISYEKTHPKKTHCFLISIMSSTCPILTWALACSIRRMEYSEEYSDLADQSFPQERWDPEPDSLFVVIYRIKSLYDQ